MALHHKLQINYGAAKKAKKAALGDYLSQQAGQFEFLPDYKDAVLRTDERSHVALQKFSGRWYAVDLLAHTCSCGRFQYNDIP